MLLFHVESEKMNRDYYINMVDVQPELLPRPRRKQRIPIITVTVDLWSVVDWI